ncbi:MAG: hypothetical protein R3283_07270, partial [Balneolaceae bacterium]|nr:hypothetical protein [Balneolaceae bacterium]
MQHLIKIISIILFPLVLGAILDQTKEAGPVEARSESPALSNPDHLDGPFTGGFGEATCHSCHFDYDLNMEGGSLTVTGFPERYQPGREYPISVRIESERLEIGGFQLTIRHLNSGNQAGSFTWNGDRIRFTPESSVGDSIQYLQHSGEGTSPTGDRL